MNNEHSIAFVTVVHSGDVPLLRLQARSFAKWATFEELVEIILIVNDVNEHETYAAVLDMLPEFGALVGKVRVLTPSDIFEGSKLTKSLGQSLRLLLAFHPWLKFSRIWAGWNGNWGWAVQQALKLGVGKVAKAEFVVIWDAKNVAVSELSFSDFISEAEKPFAILQEQNKMHRRWLPASLRLLRIPQNSDYLVTQFVTPFVVQTTFLCDACRSIEQRHGPIEALFSIRLMNAALWPIFNYTEFMILNAYAFSKSANGPKDIFDHKEAISHGLHAASSHSEILEFLGALGTKKILALHAGSVGIFDELEQERLAGFLVERQILTTAQDLSLILQEVAALNKTGIRKANKRRN